MEFVELSESEFVTFASKHPYGSFMQSPQALHIKEKGNWQGVYLGVKEHGVVVGATLLVSMPVMKKYRYFYAQRGFLMDYANTELLKYFIANIKKYCATKKGLYCRIDPYISLRERDIDGNLIEGGLDNSAMVEAMKDCGCLYCGETIGFRDDQQVRWMFALDLQGKDEETLLKEMDQQTRWSINKTKKMGIDVRYLSIAELPLFKEMMEHTSARRGFVDRDLEFYERQMNCYGEDHVRVAYATLSLTKYEANMRNELAVHCAEKAEVEKLLVEQPNSKKFNKKMKVLDEAIEIANKRVQEALSLKTEKGEELALATAFFITLDKREVIYLASGAYDEYMKFNGPYAIQWDMICYACREGFARYNFYGTSGDFQASAIDYGVYEFKKGFGGKVIELVGDFILPIDTMMFHIYNKLKKVV